MSEQGKTAASNKPRQDLGIEHVDDDVLILDKRNEKIHQLNATASLIWTAVCEGRAVIAIANELVDKFNVSREQAETDVENILQNFVKLNLLETETVI